MQVAAPARTWRAVRRLAVVLGAVAAFATITAGSALATGEVLADLDNVAGRVVPTNAQKQVVADLGATAIWNDFGTPSSLIKSDGHLATGLKGPDAATVARNWIGANRALFRLSSTAGLKLVQAEQVSEDGYTVLFRQRFGKLDATENGTASLAVKGSAAKGWSIVYAATSLTGDTAVTASPTLSATDAWLRGVSNVGRSVSIFDVGAAKSHAGWSVISVRGLSEPQRARLVALPTPTNGVRPVYETVYVDNRNGDTTAFMHYIDAVTGAVLLRKNIEEHSHPAADTFTGALPPVDGACEDRGPWTVTGSESVGAVSVVVAAHVAANDVVLHLVRNGLIVASQDTASSPEALVYDPPDSGQGTYNVRTCDFVDGTPWTPAPTNGYTGEITFSPVGAPGGLPYPPMWKAFPAYPRLGVQAFPWNYPNTDTRDLWCWESTVGFPPQPVVGPGGEACDREVQNLASRFPWDVNGHTQTPTFTTSGNNAETAEAWTSPLTPGASAHKPISASRQYVYPWTNEWHRNAHAPGAPPGCSEANLVPHTGNDISAAVTNLFTMHNRIHDWAYFLSFNERRWNAQDSNFGTGGTAENDPVVGNAQAGALNGGFPSYLGRDNANMVPTPDGVRAITNMYLWQPLAGGFYAPCVDGDYDQAVIGHEYGHLIENRMVGKGSTRGGHHMGAMGESSGDLMGAEYLNENGFVPVSDENPFSVGSYVTGNKDRAIRNYGMNFPRTGAFPTPGVSLVRRARSGETGYPAGAGPLINPLNFSDIGYDITGSQVHADGEIWSAVNYDIRQALVAKYNAQFPAGNLTLQRDCANGNALGGPLPPNQCPGNRRWIRIMFEAFVLTPSTAPSMLEMRNAYLAADQLLFSGANQAELWLAFARRGFGKDATSSNAVSNENDGDPKPDFQRLVPNTNATVTFNAVASNEGNAPVNARVYVGHYEARVSPTAVTGTPPSGTPGSTNLDRRAGFAPGEYEFVARANGYGHVRFRQTFTAGQTTTVTITMPTNFASTSKGAVAAGDGANHQHLIDDSEGTNWDEPAGGTPVNVQQPQVTVDLAGTAARTINRAQVSALLEVGQNRFVAVREFKLQTSTNGVTFSDWITSGPDAFPGFNPRPVAPEMILRSFSGPSRSATHVRIVVLDNQCTGNPKFQGEQDNDPLNPTDCRFGNPGSTTVPVFGDLPQVLAERQSEVHVTELQVFSSTGGTGGGGGNPPPPPPPDDDCDEHDHVGKLGPAVAAPGSTLVYTITYTNHGDRDDHGCKVHDRLGDDLTYVSSTGAGSYDPATRTVSWNIGSTPPGVARTVTLTARLSADAVVGTMTMNRAYFGRLGLDYSPVGTATTLVMP